MPFVLRPTRARLGAITLVVLAALFAAGCSNSDDNSSSSSTTSSAATEHNAQDVTFAKEMIPHHGQALAMARLAETQASTPEVKELAKQIEAAQQPEIDKLNAWLTSWGEPTVNPNMTMDEHSQHGQMMPGMMTADEMSKLMAGNGTPFDRMFLQMMIEHHKGAIEMAKTETAKGQFPEAKAMADSIATSQQAEVTEMEKLLTQIQ